MKQVRRLQPRHPIQARNGLLGGEKPMVCIPLVGKDHDGIVSEAKNVPSIAPDISSSLELTPGILLKIRRPRWR